MRERNGYYWDVLAYRNSRKVRAMDYETRGVYRDVLDEIWVHGSVPNDVNEIAKIITTPIEVVIRAWPAIHDALTPTRKNPDLLFSGRLEAERRKRNAIKRKKKLAAEKRWKDHAPAMHMHNTSNADAMQDYAIQEQVTSNKYISRNGVSRYTTAFEAFWEISSKRGSKWEAFSVWKGIAAELHETVHKAMLQAVTVEWANTEPRLIPHVVRWLRGRRWEVAPLVRKAGSGMVL